MSYVCERTEVEVLERLLAQERAKSAKLCAYLMECETYILSYDAKRDENERLQEVCYYYGEKQSAARELELTNAKIEYLEKQLEIIKR